MTTTKPSAHFQPRALAAGLLFIVVFLTLVSDTFGVNERQHTLLSNPTGPFLILMVVLSSALIMWSATEFRSRWHHRLVPVAAFVLAVIGPSTALYAYCSTQLEQRTLTVQTSVQRSDQIGTDVQFKLDGHEYWVLYRDAQPLAGEQVQAMVDPRHLTYPRQPERSPELHGPGFVRLAVTLASLLLVLDELRVAIWRRGRSYWAATRFWHSQ